MNKYNPDVLSCLANLSSDEIFTPPKIANDILDLLPKEVWSDKNLKFLDPSCKTGVFLREITKRLMKGLEKDFKDPTIRLNHILKNQIFGIALTELTALLSRRTLYCSTRANSNFSICDNFTDENGNIYFKPMQHSWKGGFCKICGASQSVYDRSEESESHAYNFLHSNEIFQGIKFDVIVGGPPYQLYDGGGTGASARPIYQNFIRIALAEEPKYFSMIIPARWYSGGKGLDDFRNNMRNDQRIRILVDYPDARDCFPTDLAGGVCYFLWDRDFSGECEVRTIRNGITSTSIRYLNEFETIVRDSVAVEIIKKVKLKINQSMRDCVSSRKPFGLASNYKSNNLGDLRLISSSRVTNVSIKEISSGHELIDKWKVLLSKASYDHGGQANAIGLRTIFSKIEIMQPNYVCTESYLAIGRYDTEKEAKNMAVFLKTKFCRYLVSIMLLTHNISKASFNYVPNLAMNKIWKDSKLYEYFSFSKEEIEAIENSIKALD